MSSPGMVGSFRSVRIPALCLLVLSVQLASSGSTTGTLQGTDTPLVAASNLTRSYSVTIFNDGLCIPSANPADCGYTPQSIMVKTGSTVVWTDTGGSADTVTSCSVPNNPYPLGCPHLDDPSLPSFTSALLNNGTSYSNTFTRPGTYYYFSQIHPWMQGIVQVGPVHPVHPSPSPKLVFTDITSQVHSTSLCCWLAQTIYASSPSFNGYLTVGGNGIAVYSTTNTAYPPNIADHGYLTGASWDGTEFLLVGQHYSPQGGALMFRYNPATGSLTDLSTLFPETLATNATLAEAVFNGTSFYILCLVGSEVYPGHDVSVRLYSYTNSTNTLTEITGQLPSPFQAATNNAQEMIWTPHGLFLLLQTLNGPVLGLLTNQTFTDLTSLLPTGFHLSNFNGFLTPNRFQYSMLTQADQLYIAGETAQDTIALLGYNYHTGQMTDYSPQLWSYQGTPIELTYANGQVFLTGFKQSFQSPVQPLLIAFNPRSLDSIDLSSIIPASFRSIGSIATDGHSLFVSGGEFLSINYGLITVDIQRL